MRALLRKAKWLLPIPVVLAVIIFYWLYFTSHGLTMRITRFGSASAREIEENFRSLRHRKDAQFAGAVFNIMMWYDKPYIEEQDQDNMWMTATAQMILLEQGEAGFKLYSSLLFSSDEGERKKGIEICWASRYRPEILWKIREIAASDPSIDCQFEAALRLAAHSIEADLTLCDILLRRDNQEALFQTGMLLAYGVVTRNVVEALLCLYNDKSGDEDTRWREDERFIRYLEDFVHVDNWHEATLSEKLACYREVKLYTHYDTLWEETYLVPNYAMSAHKFSFNDDFGRRMEITSLVREELGLGCTRALRVCESKDSHVNPFTGKPVESPYVKTVFENWESRFKEILKKHGY